MSNPVIKATRIIYKLDAVHIYSKKNINYIFIPKFCFDFMKMCMCINVMYLQRQGIKLEGDSPLNKPSVDQNTLPGQWFVVVQYVVF